MAAQQQQQQQPQQQQLYPPPPPFYSLYHSDADGSQERPLPPLPPPPVEGDYQQFGIADSVSFSVVSLYSNQPGSRYKYTILSLHTCRHRWFCRH
jgi:hypothetical protein